MTNEQVIALASVLAIIQGVIGWFISHSLDARLELVKGQIQQTVSEHDTRFAYLHQRRGEVIDQLYKMIDKTIRLLSASARPGRNKLDAPVQTQQSEAMKTFWKLFNYYFENRLYLDQDLCTQIEQLFDAVYRIDLGLGAASSLAPMLVIPDPTLEKELMEFNRQVRERITNELPPIRILIESKMRAILGVDQKAVIGQSAK